MLRLYGVGDVVITSSVEVRRGVKIDQRFADRIDVRRQVVVWSRLPGVREAGRDFHRLPRGQVAEIAIPILQRRHIGDFGRGAKVWGCAAKAKKEEELVRSLMDPAEGSEDFLRQIDWPAEGATRVVELSGRFQPSRRGGISGLDVIPETIVGGQRLVAGVIIDRSVGVAAAAPRFFEKLYAAVAVVSRGVTCLDPHLLNKHRFYAGN